MSTTTTATKDKPMRLNLTEARTLLGDDFHIEADVTEDMKVWTVRIVEGDYETVHTADAPTEEEAERAVLEAFVADLNFDNIDDGDALRARLYDEEV